MYLFTFMLNLFISFSTLIILSSYSTSFPRKQSPRDDAGFPATSPLCLTALWMFQCNSYQWSLQKLSIWTLTRHDQEPRNINLSRLVSSKFGTRRNIPCQIGADLSRLPQQRFRDQTEEMACFEFFFLERQNMLIPWFLPQPKKDNLSTYNSCAVNEFQNKSLGLLVTYNFL